MPTKKPSKPIAKSKLSPKKLENLAAKPPSFDDTIDEQLVDHSGVFRVTAAIQRDQIGHGDDNNPRFASDSLVMAAQRGGFVEEPTLDDPLIDDPVIEDETSVAAKRQRLATLAALAAQKKKRR